LGTATSTTSAPAHNVILAAMASSATAPAAMAAFYAGVAGNGLDERTRHRISLALARQHQCDYALAAHAAAAKRCGLTGDEISRNLRGDSEDARAALAVGLACSLANWTGRINDAQLDAIHAAGYDEGQLIDIILLVGANILENMVANVARLVP
jgi:AhpD family alkylhydroperoxidase